MSETPPVTDTKASVETSLLPVTKKNTWSIKREIGNLVIVITAYHIPRQEVWSLLCKVNGEITDTLRSVDPLGDATVFIEETIMKLV